MFDIGAPELLVIIIVAILVIGPKDMPLAMRTAGRWIGKLRKVSAHFRTGLDAMVREAELEEMEKKWKAQNEAIMKRRPDDTGSTSANDSEMTGPPAVKNDQIAHDVMAGEPAHRAASAEAKGDSQAAQKEASKPSPKEPELPLGNSRTSSTKDGG